MNASVFMWYQVNKSSIVSQLCVQRDLEVNTCMGCCQINKRLINQSETPQSTEVSVNLQFASYIQYNQPIKTDVLNIELNMFWPEFQCFTLVGYLTDIDHPPA